MCVVYAKLVLYVFALRWAYIYFCWLDRCCLIFWRTLLVVVVYCLSSLVVVRDVLFLFGYFLLLVTSFYLFDLFWDLLFRLLFVVVVWLSVWTPKSAYYLLSIYILFMLLALLTAVELAKLFIVLFLIWPCSFVKILPFFIFFLLCLRLFYYYFYFYKIKSEQILSSFILIFNITCSYFYYFNNYSICYLYFSYGISTIFYVFLSILIGIFVFWYRIYIIFYKTDFFKN